MSADATLNSKSGDTSNTNLDTTIQLCDLLDQLGYSNPEFSNYLIEDVLRTQLLERHPKTKHKEKLAILTYLSGIGVFPHAEFTGAMVQAVTTWEEFSKAL